MHKRRADELRSRDAAPAVDLLQALKRTAASLSPRQVSGRYTAPVRGIFAAWIILGVEHYPYGLLTMIVSLEAIFLSTFVMISQNRADDKRQVLADHQWQTVQDEAQQNEQLLQLSTQILELTKAIHARSTARSATGPNGTEQAASSASRSAMGE
jgi:uncharacterized membrane protein